MPNIIVIDFVLDRRPWTYQGHLATKHVDELRKLIEACSPQETSDFGNPGVAFNLVNTMTIAIGRSRFRHPSDQLANILLVESWIIVNLHGSEFQEGERPPVLSDSFLTEEHRALRG